MDTSIINTTLKEMRTHFSEAEYHTIWGTLSPPEAGAFAIATLPTHTFFVVCNLIENENEAYTIMKIYPGIKAEKNHFDETKIFLKDTLFVEEFGEGVIEENGTILVREKTKICDSEIPQSIFHRIETSIIRYLISTEKFLMRHALGRTENDEFRIPRMLQPSEMNPPSVDSDNFIEKLIRDIDEKVADLNEEIDYDPHEGSLFRLFLEEAQKNERMYSDGTQ